MNKIHEALHQLKLVSAEYGGRALGRAVSLLHEVLEEQESPWQPIETAPTDGQTILVYDRYETDGKALADGRLNQTGFDGYGVVVASFSDSHGWIVSTSVLNGAFQRLRRPTHWRSLPPPPKEPESTNF